MRINCDGAVTLIECNLSIIAQTFLTSDRVYIDKTFIERPAIKGLSGRWRAECSRCESPD